MNSKQKQTVLNRFIIIIGVILSVWLSLGRAVLADPNLPMSSQPLSNAFTNMPGSDWTAVQQTAQTEATTQPVYKSNAVENVTFSGYFQATDNTTRLAILSDDGADVYIDGQQVQTGYQQGQALPDLANSLHQLNFSNNPAQPAPDPSHIYFIKIVYSNIILTGPTDIDGVTLFCYGGGGSIVTLSANIQVRRTGSGNSFGPSAIIAAGAINSNEHKADVQVTLSPATSNVYVDVPTITAGDYNTTQGSITLTSNTTNSSGSVTGTYTSSDEVTDVTLSVIVSSPSGGSCSSATLHQHTDDLTDGSDWPGNASLNYDTPNTVTFQPEFIDTDGVSFVNVPITGHQIAIQIVAVDVQEWSSSANGGAGGTVTNTYTVDQSLKQGILKSDLSAFVTVSPSISPDSGGGVYSASIIVPWSDTETVLNVYLGYQDTTVYSQ